MPAKTILFRLAVSSFDRGFKVPSSDQYADRLFFEPESTIRMVDEPYSLVSLFDIQHVAFDQTDQRFLRFLLDIKDRCSQVANWLQKQPESLFEELRQHHLETRIEVIGWVDIDQILSDSYHLHDLLTTEMLSICESLALPIRFTTHDPTPKGLEPGDMFHFES